MRSLSSQRHLPVHPAVLARALRRERAIGLRIARLAVRSLYQELRLYPKPGLVSLVDAGSHRDMDGATFMRSLFALRHYFERITRAGMRGASFATLQRLGIEAERRMLDATGGVNTHRGAIFCIGLLCAAIGHCAAQRVALSAQAIRAALLAQWGAALAEHTRPGAADTHGLQAAARDQVSGAREEAALGLPSLFELALPRLQQRLEAGGSARHAGIDTLFALMAHISDTNVYHRGGVAGALTVRHHARQFLRDGGSANPHWEAQALAIHARFVRARLSPGGAADLLAATCFIHSVTVGEAP